MFRSFACLILAVTGCGPSTTAPVGGGIVPDAADSGPLVYGPQDVEIDPAAPPAAVRFGDCANGWRSVTIEGATVCHPFAADSGPEACPTGQAHFVGRPGCEPIGPACPEGDFASDLPTDRVVWHVQPGAQNGNGTRERPFATIGRATQVASDGQVIALSKGTFNEVVELRSGITLIGACVEETLVTADLPEFFPGVIRVSDGPARSDVSSAPQTGDTGFGIYAADGATVTGNSIGIERARGFAALSIMSARVELTDLRIEETLRTECTTPDCLTLGVGASALNSAHLELHQFTIDGSALCGAQLALGGTLFLQEGTVIGNPIGLNIQADNFDIESIHSSVEFMDNERTIDASELPVPATGPSLIARE